MRSETEIERVQIRLRAYQAQDFQALWKLDQRCFEDGISYSKAELQQYLQLKTAFALVAQPEGDSAICGFIIAHRRRGGFGHVLTIDVAPEFRQHGVGTLLLRAAHARLAKEGCHTMFLETAVNNLPAISFYKRHGYSVVRTLPRYYQATGMDAFLLSKPLDTVAHPI